MRDLVQKEVDGRSYEFEQFNTTTALKTLTKLTRILGEPLMIAIGSFAKKPPSGKLNASGVPEPVANILDRDISELSSEAMVKAVGTLIERMDETEVVSLVKQLTSEKVLCDNKPILFDEHYRGDISHLFKVLGAALEAQYGNFLGAVTARASSATAGKPISVRM